MRKVLGLNFIEEKHGYSEPLIVGLLVLFLSYTSSMTLLNVPIANFWTGISYMVSISPTPLRATCLVAMMRRLLDEMLCWSNFLDKKTDTLSH